MTARVPYKMVTVGPGLIEIALHILVILFLVMSCETNSSSFTEGGTEEQRGYST